MSTDELPNESAFSRRFSGEIISRRSVDFDAARKLWNGDIDRRPLAVVKAVDDADVSTALTYAVDNGLPLAVRGGGHSYAGHSMCEGGITVDLSNMRTVTADLDAQRARIGGGALLGSVDQILVPHGQVMPAGVVSHTGMPGLALGGGVGYLSRSLGLTCDQFIRLRVVTVSGEVVHASADENPDLFWALRGGGGNFGVVTEFECRTHTLGPVQAGFLAFPMSEAPDVILALKDVLQGGPRELGLSFSHGVEPARLGLADEVNERLLGVLVVYRGGADDPILAEVRNARKPLVDTIKTANFLDIQTMIDEEAVAGVGWYMKSGYTREVSRPLLEWLAENSVEYRDNVSSPKVTREVYTLQALGGAVQDVGENESAYSGRAANWHVAIEAGFTDAEERGRIVPWIRDSWQKTQSLLDMSTSYVNLNVEEGASRLRDEIFGPEKFDKLQRIKAEYDPGNALSLNWNIPPLGTDPRLVVNQSTGW